MRVNVTRPAVQCYMGARKRVRGTRGWPPLVVASVESWPHAQPHYFLVVFGFVGYRYLTSVGRVDAAPATATGVARILARTHFGMPTAQRGDLLLKLDRCDCAILTAAADTSVNGTGRNGSGVEVVSYGWAVHGRNCVQGYH